MGGAGQGSAGCETMSGMKTTLLLATLTGLFISGRSLAGLFSTHPPVEQRIERLMALNR